MFVIPKHQLSIEQKCVTAQSILWKIRLLLGTHPPIQNWIQLPNHLTGLDTLLVEGTERLLVEILGYVFEGNRTDCHPF